MLQRVPHGHSPPHGACLLCRNPSACRCAPLLLCLPPPHIILACPANTGLRFSINRVLSPASSFVLERDDFCSGSWYRHEHQFLFTLLPVSVLALAFELSSQLTSLRSLLQAMPCCMVFACSPALLPSSDVFPFNTVPNPEVLSPTQLLTAMQSVLLTGWGAHPVLSAQLLFDSPIP